MSEKVASGLRVESEQKKGLFQKEQTTYVASATLTAEDSGHYTAAYTSHDLLTETAETATQTKFRWKGAALADFSRSPISEDEKVVGSPHPLMQEFREAGGHKTMAQVTPLHKALEDAAGWQTLSVEGSLSNMRIQGPAGKELATLMVSPDAVHMLVKGEKELTQFPMDRIDDAAKAVSAVVQNYVADHDRTTPEERRNSAMMEAFSETATRRTQAEPLARSASTTDRGFRILELREGATRPDGQVQGGFEISEQQFTTPSVIAPLARRADLNAEVGDPAHEARAARPTASFALHSEHLTSTALEVSALAIYLAKERTATGNAVQRLMNADTLGKIHDLGGQDALVARAPVLSAVEGMVRNTGMDVQSNQATGDTPLRLMLNGPSQDAKGPAPIAVVEFSKTHITFTPEHLATLWSKNAQEQAVAVKNTYDNTRPSTAMSPNQLQAAVAVPSSVRPQTYAESQGIDALTASMTRVLQDTMDGPKLMKSKVQEYSKAERERRKGGGDKEAQEATLMALAPVLREDIQDGRLPGAALSLKSSLLVWEQRAQEPALLTARRTPSLSHDRDER